MHTHRYIYVIDKVTNLTMINYDEQDIINFFPCFIYMYLFVPLRPFFCAALMKRWKVQFRQG